MCHPRFCPIIKGVAGQCFPISCQLEWEPFVSPVIPAKARIYSVVGLLPMAREVDSRLRGKDGTWEGLRLASGRLAHQSEFSFAAAFWNCPNCVWKGKFMANWPSKTEFFCKNGLN
jgi:hypothetical protein